MKTIALVMAYNEGELVYKCLEHIYDTVDQIIVFEGTVSPFDDQSEHSQDNTIEEIKKFIINKNNYEIGKFDKIVFWSPGKNREIKTREHYEAWIKNEMLKLSFIEDGDLIFMVDVDEYYDDGGAAIIEHFKLNDKIVHASIGEYQFAYNMKWEFKASHDGRFLRYKNGAKYSASQHFIYPDGKDISRDKSTFIPREMSGMHHLCWVKHPDLIRQKVLTFKRPSFTAWYNHCYLVWPFDAQMAYKNNEIISAPMGWPGTGFAEGQTEKLVGFSGKFPSILRDYKPDWTEYIKNNVERLAIR